MRDQQGAGHRLSDNCGPDFVHDHLLLVKIYISINVYTQSQSLLAVIPPFAYSGEDVARSRKVLAPQSVFQMVCATNASEFMSRAYC